MNKILFTFIILLSNPFISFAQDEWFINLQDQWKSATHDTTRVLILAEFSNFYKYRKLDSALAYGYKSWSLAREIDFPKGEIRAIQYIALAYHLLGNDSKGLQICLQGIEIADENGLIHEKAVTRIVVGRIYLGMKNHIKALHSFRQAKQYIMTIHLS